MILIEGAAAIEASFILGQAILRRTGLLNEQTCATPLAAK